MEIILLSHPNFSSIPTFQLLKEIFAKKQKLVGNTIHPYIHTSIQPNIHTPIQPNIHTPIQALVLTKTHFIFNYNYEMNFEDHFSELAETYSKYRPGYPSALFEYLASCCFNHKQAWDCGTGNGQAAVELTKFFDQVIATDASREQIEQASAHPKIIYRVESAEDISLPDSSTDLVTVAVAVHWFNFDKFYSQVKRILTPGGVIAVWTYSSIKISPQIDAIIDKYMNETLKDYWPERFHYVRSGYRTLPFPFKEIPSPKFEMITEWDLGQLNGFLNSWSGTKNSLNKTSRHPLNEIWNDLTKAWGDEQTKYMIHWPIHVRIGK